MRSLSRRFLPLEAHCILHRNKHTLKDNSGLFQPAVSLINVAIMALLVVLTLHSPPQRFRETMTHAKQRTVARLVKF